MNHLSKRCGCGAIFTLPNLKSRETRCTACARPKAVVCSPVQRERFVVMLCLFAGEMSARGWHQKKDRDRQRAKRAPSWAEVDAARPVPAPGGYFEPSSDMADAVRYAMQERAEALHSAGLYGPAKPTGSHPHPGPSFSVKVYA